MAIKQHTQLAHFRLAPQHGRRRTARYVLTTLFSVAHRNWSKLSALFFILIASSFFVFPTSLFAQDVSADVSSDSVFQNTQEFYFGKVTIIFSEGETPGAGFDEKFQRVNVHVSNGPDAGEDEMIEYSMTTSAFEAQKLEIGDTVIINKSVLAGDESYVILDKFRIPGVLTGMGIFFLLAIIFGGMRGVTSLFGLGASLAILAFAVVPAILAGHDPLLVSVIGAGCIAVVSILLAHGFNRRSGIALGATLITLIGAVLFSIFAVWLAKLSGSGTEEAIYLQLGSLPSLNLRGLLLGGMIIGTLGVLDDVTTTQVSTVEEISIADSSLTRKELYRRGLRVGREHIASLVNTLALAYAGASFPLFLLFALEGGPPLWIILNAEYVMEEVVRAVVGGAALVIAVPISTVAAAWFYGKRE